MTDQKGLQDNQVEIQGKVYTLDGKRVKFGLMMDLAAKLKSGMKAKVDDEGKAEMTFTEEYARQEQVVLKTLAVTLFALDVDIDQLDFEEAMPLIEKVRETNFLDRLSQLGTSTASKSK